MNQQSPQNKPARKSPHAIGDLITDPAELARTEAETIRVDGVERMIGAALEVVRDHEARGRPVDILQGILGLADLLTPEQRLELSRLLQGHQPGGA